MSIESFLHLIAESEATATEHSLSIGDIFVLCDVGGVTVDLLSYRVVALESILQIEEAAAQPGIREGIRKGDPGAENK